MTHGIRWMTALGLSALAPFAATAAGFDCAKASTPVEKAICASPSLSALDGKLGDAFRKALAAQPSQTEVLKLDQRHWLASRDDSAWALLSGDPKSDVAKSLASTYKARIAFLGALGGKAAKPLDVVQGALARLPAGSSGILADLARQGAPVTLATEVDIDEKTPFPLKADAALRKAMVDGDPGQHYYKLDGSPVGSVSSVGGTAHCISEAPYRVEGARAIGIDTPPVWGDDCMTDHAMARLGDDIAALRIDGMDGDEATLAASRWDGKTFGAAHALVLRFDRTLSLVGAACAPAEFPCAEFGTAALAAATRYDRSPIPGTLDRALTGADKSSYDALLAVARSKDGIVGDSVGANPTALPTFDKDVSGSGMSDYGSEATFFPVTFRGETLVGYIGHGHVGWRINDDWLVSAWRLKNGKLEPVASAYIAVKRGKLLLSAPVAPAR